jgi:ribosomal protein L11 methyltransferase
MPAYIEIILPEPDADIRGLAILELERLGFEGFEEESGLLKAYIPEGQLDESAFAEMARGLGWEITRNLLEEQNWNQLWESSFDPVVVDGFCAIRADFHAPVPGVEQEIVITPKMSFGTGHHHTTYLMISRMRTLPLEGKRVVDFGTGTGILAILAERLGAASVWALDNDPWSIDNALENKERNGLTKMSIHLASDLSAESAGIGDVDILLANINRPILLEQMPAMAALVVPGGYLLLSGILAEDGEILKREATLHGFTLSDESRRGDWLAQLWEKGEKSGL